MNEKHKTSAKYEMKLSITNEDVGTMMKISIAKPLKF